MSDYVVIVNQGPRGPKGDDGDSFQPSATGLLAGRDAYDTEPVGFSYLATDNSTVFPAREWLVGRDYGRKGDARPGPAGPAGSKGDPGSTGFAGPAGAAGATGATARLARQQQSPLAM